MSNLYNISIESDDITNVLPRGADSNVLLIVKLLRQLSYRNHVYFEDVRPEIDLSSFNVFKTEYFIVL